MVIIILSVVSDITVIFNDWSDNHQEVNMVISMDMRQAWSSSWCWYMVGCKGWRPPTIDDFGQGRHAGKGALLLWLVQPGNNKGFMAMVNYSGLTIIVVNNLHSEDWYWESTRKCWVHGGSPCWKCHLEFHHVQGGMRMSVIASGIPTWTIRRLIFGPIPYDCWIYPFLLQIFAGPTAKLSNYWWVDLGISWYALQFIKYSESLWLSPHSAIVQNDLFV